MFALGAGEKFDVNGTTEYIETIICEYNKIAHLRSILSVNITLTHVHTHTAKCIDHYTELRVKQFEKGFEEGEYIDSRLEVIVDRMFDRCLHDRRYKQAVGIALETHRVDILQRAIHESVSVLLRYL